MAGWGTGSFENEDAQNFLGRINSLGVDDLRSILARAADQDDYLEAPESSVAVAAAEVVAALVVAAKKEAPSLAVSPKIVEWTLKDRWLEAEGLNEWSAALRDLEERLRG